MSVPVRFRARNILKNLDSADIYLVKGTLQNGSKVMFKEGIGQLASVVLSRSWGGADCAWVRERLSAYCEWDLSETEFAAVENHLYRCPECAAQRKEIQQATDLEAEALLWARGDFSTPEDRTRSIMAAFEGYENERGSDEDKALGLGLLGWVKLKPAMAASLSVALIFLATGAYALNGGQLWDDFVEWVNPTEVKETVGPTEGGSGQVVSNGIGGSEDSGVDSNWTSITIPEHFETAVDTFIDEAAAEAYAKAQVEALLPQTEEEYEAWARKEFPHVMWLYDILIEDYDYDGSWRDLLVKSGEIYRFDWPTSLAEPNVLPRLEGVKNAAVVAQYVATTGNSEGYCLPLSLIESEGIEDGFLQISPMLAAITREEASFAVVPMPDDYLSDDTPTDDVLVAALQYVVVSAEIEASPGFQQLALRCCDKISDLIRIREVGGIECSDTATKWHRRVRIEATGILGDRFLLVEKEVGREAEKTKTMQ